MIKSYSSFQISTTTPSDSILYTNKKKNPSSCRDPKGQLLTLAFQHHSLLFVWNWIWCARISCLPVCLCTKYGPGTHTVLKRHQILWNWSYRCLWASMWVLGTTPGPVPSVTFCNTEPSPPCRRSRVTSLSVSLSGSGYSLRPRGMLLIPSPRKLCILMCQSLLNFWALGNVVSAKILTVLIFLLYDWDLLQRKKIHFL